MRENDQTGCSINQVYTALIYDTHTNTDCDEFIYLGYKRAAASLLLLWLKEYNYRNVGTSVRGEGGL